MIHLTILLITSLFAGPQTDVCENIRAIALQNATITSVQFVPAGPYRPNSSERKGQEAGPALPEHCRVAAVLKPASDSHIEMEIWLPTRNWNGKFLGLDNGSWAGSINLSAIAEGISRGYAAASTDTGHTGDTAEFVIGHPERLTDFAYRAIHEMTVRSKDIIQGFYSKPPSRSYFEGCSTGGWQGFTEAQRYPADFDAIVAGAPVYRRIHLHAQELENVLEVFKDAKRYVSQDTVQMIAKAVITTCDANDGVVDGLINDPQTCHFDPRTLLCGSDSANCLTPAQVISLERAYAPTNTTSGAFVYPGHARGFELGWRMPEPGSGPRRTPPMSFADLGYGDPNWDWKTFDLDKDLALAVTNGGVIEATNADLSAFKARGGKLIIYHGWSDPGPSPFDTIQYYNDVAERTGTPDQSDWMRLFMLPGVGHCDGGPGPDQVNFLGALERWFESGVAPDRITASKVTNGQTQMRRPLCPYPRVAKWNGVGSTNDADNFVCSTN